MTQRILMLDIDGPIINTPCYYIHHLASVERRVMNTQAIGYVAKILQLSGAKLVMNTTHNDLVVEGRTVKDDMIDWGMPEHFFHEDWKTDYPFCDRDIAVKVWLEDHDMKFDSNDWMSFDDAKFTFKPNLILVDFETGIDYDAYIRAMLFWELEDSVPLFKLAPY